MPSCGCLQIVSTHTGPPVLTRACGAIVEYEGFGLRKVFLSE